MAQPGGVPLERGITDPLDALWTREPDSVRRTVTITAAPINGWDGGYHVVGIARDIVIGPDRSIQLEQAARLVANMDPIGKVKTMTVTDASGPRNLTDLVVGRNIGAGWRSILAKFDDPVADDSLAGALLDDMSGIRHVAGYGRITAGPQPLGFLAGSPQIGTCAGWMAGGVAANASEVSILGDLPWAPSMEQLVTDEGDWHQEESASPGSMQRRRLLDVRPVQGGGTELRMWFRDSRFAGSDDDRGLHEYVVLGRLDASGLLAGAKAQPRSLPMGDCPLAAEHVSLLDGRPVDRIDEGVRAHLRGELGCTHLNDAMRFLRSAKPMLNLLS
ncbi:MAG: DUF2889 domain-containing protein [Candidatus Nanopelagicales bacterium]